MPLLAIYTTVATHEQAQRMARALLEQKLVACAQIKSIESFYSWQGELQHDQEFQLLLKSRVDKYADIEAAILKLHPYDLPAIYALPVQHAFQPYAAWVEASITPE